MYKKSLIYTAMEIRQRKDGIYRYLLDLNTRSVDWSLIRLKRVLSKIILNF
jgi:hypothetical protein